MEAEVSMMQDHEPRNAGSSKSGKVKEVDSALEPPEGMQPLNPFRTSDLQNARIKNLCLGHYSVTFCHDSKSKTNTVSFKGTSFLFPQTQACSPLGFSFLSPTLLVPPSSHSSTCTHLSNAHHGWGAVLAAGASLKLRGRIFNRIATHRID